MKFQYTSFKFIEPDMLDENQFNNIKKLLDKDPNIKLDSAKRDFISHFRFPTLLMVGEGLIATICILLPENSFLKLIALICLVMILFGLMQIIAELFSFLSYYLDRKSYFNKLKGRIINNKTYELFYKTEPEHKRRARESHFDFHEHMQNFKIK